MLFPFVALIFQAVLSWGALANYSIIQPTTFSLKRLMPLLLLSNQHREPLSSFYFFFLCKFWIDCPGVQLASVGVRLAAARSIVHRRMIWHRLRAIWTHKKVWEAATFHTHQLTKPAERERERETFKRANRERKSPGSCRGQQTGDKALIMNRLTGPDDLWRRGERLSNLFQYLLRILRCEIL